MRILGRGAALVVGVALALLLLAQPASAHADLTRSEPSDGAVLAEPPTVARLWFSEEISARFSSIRLVDSRGTTVGGPQLEANISGPRQLMAKLPTLAAGTYGLVWRVLAQDDGHTTGGVIVFTVGMAGSTVPVTLGASATSGTVGTAPAPAGVLLRWLGLCLLAGVIGGLTVAGPVLGMAKRVARSGMVTLGVAFARRRILAVVAGCAVLASLLGLVDLVEESRRAVAGDSRPIAYTMLDLLSGTRWGHLWLARELLLPALAALALVLRARVGRPRIRPGQAASAAAASLVLAAVLIEALGSHAVALQSARGFAVVADALHVLTALVWLGALPAIVLALWPPVAGIDRRALIRACRGPFTGLLTATVAVLLMTGLYSAGRQVAEPGQLVTTGYGRTLLLKVGLLAVVGGLGMSNSVLLHGRAPAPLQRMAHMRLGGSPSRRLILIEATAGAILIAAAGVLAETAPARAPSQVAAASATPAASSGTLNDIVVSVSASPNKPGVNGFTVLAASSRRPPPAPIGTVTLKLVQAGTTSTVLLQRIEPGRYFGTGRLDSTGEVTMTAVVRRAGKRLSVAVPWQLSDGRPPPAPPPGRQLAPYVNALALGLLGLALAVAAQRVVSWRRRRPPATTVPAPAEMILEDVR